MPQLLVGVTIREMESVGTRVSASDMFQLLVQIRTREAEDAVFASELDVLFDCTIPSADDTEGLLGPPQKKYRGVVCSESF